LVTAWACGFARSPWGAFCERAHATRRRARTGNEARREIIGGSWGSAHGGRKALGDPRPWGFPYIRIYGYVLPGGLGRPARPSRGPHPGPAALAARARRADRRGARVDHGSRPVPRLDPPRQAAGGGARPGAPLGRVRLPCAERAHARRR